MLDRITPLILTLDEAPNVRRTLERLAWAKDIVVVDSGSTDGTTEILKGYPNVRVFTRAFTTHAEQWNFGLEHTGIKTEWVLALDADFVLSDALVKEFEALRPESGVDGFRAKFTYCIDGKALRCAVYPPIVVLYRRAGARYEQDGHTQRVQVSGRVENLVGTVFHDDRKPLAQWLAAQARYMRLEARKLDGEPATQLGWADRSRLLIVVAPPVMFLYCLVVRGGILDGKAGLVYALQRTVAEVILSLYLLQRKVNPGNEPDSPR
jgi:glycosyltransferase involved in cell wall biosynthesis